MNFRPDPPDDGPDWISVTVWLGFILVVVVIVYLAVMKP